MILNLNKKTKSRKVTLLETAAASPSSASSGGASPYTFFYPEAVTHSIALVEEALDPAQSPDFHTRNEVRSKKKLYFEEQAVTFDQFKSSNLVTIHKAFAQNITHEGMLERKAYHAALASIGVTDDRIINRTFDLFDAKKESIVDYREVICALDVIVNGTNKHITMQDCFALFDPTNCGYVIENCLSDLKLLRAEEGNVNHLMVKALLEIFDRLQALEAEKHKKELQKRSKRRGKAKGAAPPLHYAKKIHMSYEEFCEFMATEPLLVQAFLARILATMEEVYMRNKKTATLQLGAKKKPEGVA
eukprot:NODE_2897_length_1068_cov_12.060574_g2764_i0.p2 GENE.NODE_2897_length_1068_cov_12.060574_g2764_i0~~NODE_2897_length_1068_cov_12.060574_g2764_i0.p2  ORF type:complete len:303 (+),score=106.00 NODE_2897_length_1068_cov_12.060574_g2764_i0:63-971(+)